MRQLFSGKLLAVLAWRGQGAATVEVSSPGLESARLALDGGDGGGEPRLPEITPSAPLDVLPVRKIELHASRTVLTPEEPVAELTAEIYPPEAGFRDLEWRATDARGITVPYVKLEVVEGCPQRVRATGLGDGVARIRCTSRNGKEFSKIISTLELQTEGMGSMYMNPYGYLSAALYTKSHGGIGNGNERGIATSRTEMSWVAYEGVDFGRDGADTLTISVFEMSGVPTPIRFWKGEPYAPGSKMIGERIYDKPTTWNVYKDETFQLDEPLTGTDAHRFRPQVWRAQGRRVPHGPQGRPAAAPCVRRRSRRGRPGRHGKRSRDSRDGHCVGVVDSAPGGGRGKTGKLGAGVPGRLAAGLPGGGFPLFRGGGKASGAGQRSPAGDKR